MKIKNVLSLVICILTVHAALAQGEKLRYPYLEGFVSVGVIPTFVKDQIHTEFPPVMLGMNYRLNERYSVGLIAGHTRVRSAADLMNDGDFEQFQNKFYLVGGRFAVHSTYFEKWDLYGGMNFAYTISHVDILRGNITLLKKHLNFKPVKGSFMTSAFLGARFLIKPKTSLFGEVGYGISLLSFGITRRL
ncbi:MAG: hypothetical protein KDC85_14175 [Saprospiraceae bacterium]|nr:hypothetical protein [Saprospiraceae bacterium]MCB9324244.1 hypothetical protein [Lewinellaceae bacterium]